MRLNVGAKLWLAFFCTLTFTVLAMYGLLHSSLKQSFLDQTSQQAVQRIEILRDALVKIYRDEDGFSTLAQEPERWLSVKSIIFSYRVKSNINEDDQRVNDEMAQRFYRDFVTSLSLFDREKQLILGVIKPNKPITWVPLIDNGATLGFIGFVKPDIVVEEADRRFLNHQLKFFGWLSIAVLLISIAVATVLTRRISQPIRLLSQHTRALSAGNFQQRLAIISRDEIGQLSADFNQLAKTLEANEQSRAAWVADISHEMRTPLAVAKAQIEAMQDGVRALDAKNLAVIHQKVEGLNTLVDDLFELSLSDIGALQYKMQPVALNTLVRRIAEQYSARAATAGLSLQAQSIDATVTVQGDEHRLEQLLSNLLENALRYTSAPGAVEIELTADDYCAVLIVRDSAPTVPEAQRELIFDRLHRLENSRSRDTGGAGLGLAICSNIVAAHQGTIRAEDSALGGISLRVEIPRLP